MTQDVFAAVRKALGRTVPLSEPPVPPRIEEGITRLVSADGDLAGRFIEMCHHNKMGVEVTTADALPARLGEFLRSKSAKRIALSAGGLVERMGLKGALREQGFEAADWSEMSLDALYDYDCGITDVDAAVAETGTLVVRASAGNGRGLSLVPAVHIAVVESGSLVADLVDLFAMLGRDGVGSAVTLITGPSKTSDIEMNLVVGVHGPVQVQVFLVG